MVENVPLKLVMHLRLKGPHCFFLVILAASIARATEQSAEAFGTTGAHRRAQISSRVAAAVQQGTTSANDQVDRVRQAAERGDASAQFELGQRYAVGNGI